MAGRVGGRGRDEGRRMERERERVAQTVHVRPSLPRSSDHVVEHIIHAKLLLRPPRLYLRINTHAGYTWPSYVCAVTAAGAIRIASDLWPGISSAD